MESCQYRDYQIETQREWSKWCVSVYRTRSNLPILPQPTLHTLTPRKDDAVTDAKHSIDRFRNAHRNVASTQLDILSEYSLAPF